MSAPRTLSASSARGELRAPPRRRGPRGERPGTLSSGGGNAPREHLAEIQRSRLLAAAIGEIGERGFAEATVEHITRRARVSRRTFYETFANREECLGAVLDYTVELVKREFTTSQLTELPWVERVREGLWLILSLFDREPRLARVCVVEVLHGGGPALGRREDVLARLTAAVDAGRRESARAESCTALTSEGAVGAALAIVHARLLRDDAPQLRELQGELMGMIVLPYLGTAAARREQARPTPFEPVPAARGRRRPAPALRDPLSQAPMRLTYRTIRVLEGAGEHPGSSNRQIADYAGINDPGQISRLLRRLERLGLLVNQEASAHSKGEPNAWTLTSEGKRLIQGIHAHTTTSREAA